MPSSTEHPPLDATSEHGVVNENGHQVQIKRWTRGSGKSKYVVRCTAWCRCGDSAPLMSSNGLLTEWITEHVKREQDNT